MASVIWDQETPCATCPYRRDTKLQLWREVEFTDLRAKDSEPMTSPVYGCHSSAKLPEAERRPCAGWLLDQKRRNIPSIPLRVALIRTPEARELLDKVNDGGADLYDSIKEMHEANYPPIPARWRRTR